MPAGEGGPHGLDPPVQAARARAAWTVGLLGFCVALAAVDLVQESLRLVQLNRLAGSCVIRLSTGCSVVDSSATLSAVHDLDTRAQALLIADTVSVLVTGIVWLTWQHRVQSLVGERLAVPGLRFTPGWAVGNWFIPFVNLVVPAQVTAEQWRASGGSENRAGPWQARRLPAFLGWWWAFWLGRVALGVISRSLAGSTTASNLSTVRANALALTAGAGVTVVAGVLAMRVVRSIQGRLETATPYLTARPIGQALGLPWQQPATPAGGGSAPPSLPPPPARVVPASATSAPAGEPAAMAAGPIDRPPAGGPTRTLASVVAVVAVVAALALAITSPAVRATGDVAGGAAATASAIPPFATPAGWRSHQDTGATFTIAAPAEWEERPGGGLLLLSAPTSTDVNLVLAVNTEVLKADLPLEQYVAASLEHLHDPQAPKIVGEPRTEPVALPAGRAEIIRFHALLDDGSEASFVQYVLVLSRKAWVLTFVAPPDQEAALEPLFAQVGSTFVVTG